MHTAEPYGHLLVNGRPVTETQLANLTGIPQDQIPILLGELDNAGVYTRNAKGVIYSRRMTRDASKAAKCSRAGKSGGGNPTFKGDPKGEYKGHPTMTFAPEARGQIPEKDPKKVLENVSKALKRESTWTPEQRKTAWQSKICNEAARIMSADDYAKFLIDWTNGEPWAKRKAEELDAGIKRERARA